MAISFDRALGIHERAMQVRLSRAELLANNLANVDTPNFKARDVDFRSVLKSEQSRRQHLSMQRTHERHIGQQMGGGDSAEVMYRVPLQPAIDGNTVEEQMELAEYTKNAVDFQASFFFLNSKFKGLRNALTGESS